jgi:hypothetical protein
MWIALLVVLFLHPNSVLVLPTNQIATRKVLRSD